MKDNIEDPFGFQNFPKIYNRTSDLFIDLIDLVKKAHIDNEEFVIDPTGLITECKNRLKIAQSLYEADDQETSYKKSGVISLNLDSARYDEFTSSIVEKGSIRITLAPIGIKLEEFQKGLAHTFSTETCNRLDHAIEGAILEAQKRGSNVIIFPELSLPRRSINRYLNLCAKHRIMLIAGMEYTVLPGRKAKNGTVISIPVNKNEHPLGLPYLAFEQIKHFPAAAEKQELLDTAGTPYEYYPGDSLFIFKSDKIGSFGVLTCSDFHSIRLRFKLQREIQTLYIPAQTFDNTTYKHLAEVSIRELHALTVVCNNPKLGSSFVYAPHYNHMQRSKLKKLGEALPEFATIDIRPKDFLESQNEDSQTHFRKKIDDSFVFPKLKEVKQLPPDWGYDDMGKKRKKLKIG